MEDPVTLSGVPQNGELIWIRLSAGAEEAGLRLDQFVYRRVTTFSRMYLRRLFDEDRVILNGAGAPPGRRIVCGDEAAVQVDENCSTSMSPEHGPLTILYEDADLLVVDKPAGMVMHPAGRHRSRTLANFLTAYLNPDPPVRVRPGLPHRLDGILRDWCWWRGRSRLSETSPSNFNGEK